MIFADSDDALYLGCKYTVTEGVLMFSAQLMISFNRGTPSVTFLLDTPA